jgi:hypothetical protein
MNEIKTLKTALFCVGMLTLTAVTAQTMSKADYSATKTRITADYKADKTACNTLAGNTKDICVEKAKAKEDVARAELEYSFTGKSADRIKVLKVKAKSAYSVAKERCDDLSGNAKDVCVKEAQAVEKKALANAKMGKEIDEAVKDAAAETMDADYKVAIEKCDSLAGDTKSNCITAAKAQFRKS